VNPIVAAALIAGGASALVAVTGFLTTRSMTVRQLAAARQSRLWDKQAAIYADAVSAIRWQQDRRHHEFFALEHGGGRPPKEKPPVDWVELQGRLFAFASPEVLTALKAASDAGLLARGMCNQLYFLIRNAVDADRAFDRENDSTDEIERVIDETRQAVRDAGDRDDVLIDVIRADLQGERGRALAVLNPPSPQALSKITRHLG
jgi:hypothetical protein